ncbi:MAG TPA: glycosyl hydrolase family 65 protein [Thermoanaerobaculia bacterium]|nr:glycosyl hydrolase family 65 protein [Thermoanaerobaculia bacterium]
MGSVSDASRDRYGHFSPDGREYIVTDPCPPRPWANVISNERLGLAVSQSGSGFTWIDNSQLAVVNWWQQDFAQDSSGKFLYLRDRDSGQAWSLSPAPMWPSYSFFECRHGIGYSEFVTALAGIEAHWTLFPHPTETVELWTVRLRNTGATPRSLDLTGYLEWCCGVTPAPRREFHKLFIETEFDAKRNAVFGWSRMWDIGSKRWGHWNTDFPYVCGFGTTARVASAEGEKSEFTGRNGTTRDPAALRLAKWRGLFGKHYDPVAAMRSVVELKPGEEKTVGFAISVADARSGAESLLSKWLDIKAMERALDQSKQSWIDRLAQHRVETPDARFNSFVNDWVRYQAISARIWGRAGYYQQSGAYGFRDQLQDSQVWLTIEPPRTRAQIKLHAEHQFADGSVYHWWHPLSEQGHITQMTDDLLWMSFVTPNYIRETGDFSVLEDESPFLDEAAPAPLEEHVRRAFERVFRRTSDRGLPFIGAGDWNDGLSAAGLEEKGESIWLAHFLAGCLGEWAEIHRRSGRAKFAAGYAERRDRLVAAINEHGWDGAWYWRATLDDGEKIGSAKNRVGRVYLNAQTWAILNDIAPADRARACMDAVRTHLVSEAGALLLAPAYDEPDERIGYITRYAPGLRENGGVYTHAATWAIAAAAKVKDASLVERLLIAIDPTNKDPERYWAEPYVLPGNVDGPDSPLYGRAGWTWYTGSAAWLHRIVAEWVLGVRPDWDALIIDPCLPPSWDRARMTRVWRGATYDIRIERGGGTTGPQRLPVPKKKGEKHEIRVNV